MIYSIHFSGLGGQGVLTLTRLLAEYTRGEGYITSLFNSKGMAQRGGRVTSDIRIFSGAPEQTADRADAPSTGAPAAEFEPRIGEGNADMVVGLEIGEAVNSLPLVKPEGTALLYSRRSIPADIVLNRHARYPEAEEVREIFSRHCKKALAIPETEGPANIYLLGVLTAILPSAGSFFGIDLEKLEKILRGRLKRDIDRNIETMKKGYEYGRQLVKSL
jgi:indolepyruvate ferredoxin oxidoreductase beta subunit